jgi:CubicO group peptidase (beta-lactamase class C family)
MGRHGFSGRTSAWAVALAAAFLPPSGTRADDPPRQATVAAAAATPPANAQAPTVATPAPLPRSTPEAQGVSSDGVRAFVEAADAKVKQMHSFVLVRHGHVVAEAYWSPQGPDVPHVMHSLSKSFTSTAVGLAVAEGKLSVDDLVLKFFPEDAPPEPPKNLKLMRVRDLLTMSCGHQTELGARKVPADVPWTKAFLAHPVDHKPGTHFLYNSAGTYMLSAIVQKVTGQTVHDYLMPRLFEPLGIKDPEWEASPQGINCGGWGLYLRSEDVAKLGLLYLHKGVWNGKQLVPATWVEQATARQMSNGSDPTKDWDQGYGFQFWRCRHGAFRGDGANGQFCLVLPEQDAVVAITADTRDMQAELNVVWDYLLPALKAGGPLAADPAAEAKLKQMVGGLKVAPAPTTGVAKPAGG